MPSSGAPTDRKFADSLLEEAGFEPSVPRLRWSSVQLVARDATDTAIAKPDRRSHLRGDEPGLEAWASSFRSIHNIGDDHAGGPMAMPRTMHCLSGTRHRALDIGRD